LLRSEQLFPHLLTKKLEVVLRKIDISVLLFVDRQRFNPI